VEATLSALIDSAERGEAAAADALFAALYGELHRLADRQLARSAAGAALDTTSLLHDAYLEMAGREGASFPDRARFLGYAARVMRGLIVDRIRRGAAQKRGGRFEITAFGEGKTSAAPAAGRELESLSAALGELARIEPELAQVVDLKYFCGFTFVEIAALRNLSERTVQRQWDKARLFLRHALGGEEGP
jgi:RNA polymerase sigma factor (TIGR02999 family)